VSHSDDNLPVEPGTEGHLPEPVRGDPVPDPGLPAHEWRPTDVDEAAAKRAERQVATYFTLAMVCVVLFIVSYVTLSIGDDPDVFLGLGASNLALGASLGGALLFIGIGVIQLARKLMGDHEIVEMRHPVASSPEDREATLAALALGAEESGLGRRPLVRNTMIGALGLVGLTPIIALRDLGPTPSQVANSGVPGAGLENTVWTKGMRVVRDVLGTPILASDLEIGDLVNAQPGIVFDLTEDGQPILEGVERQIAVSKASVVVLRMEPDDITPAKGRENWSVDGIVCYSKICTHVGCPISLNERTTHLLLCPCHQSTFDLADNGAVVFGPAARPLPQLPLAVDSEGYLVAQSDFTEPVGPSYWERDSE
jgi:ubiquinol-cytochrome c reductase iron-sulfur subunit